MKPRARPLRPTALRSGKGLQRTTRVKATNPKRHSSEFARCYGNRERVRWVKAQPCVFCGKTPSDNAHIPSRSGMGRKGDSTQIVPACRACHTLLDTGRLPTCPPRALGIMASVIEAAWQVHVTRRRFLSGRGPND